MLATYWTAILLVGRVDALQAPPYDLAFFQQIVWNVGRDGRWVSDFHQGSFLGLHFSLILVVPALIERLLWSDVRVLSLIHAATVGAFVPATFLFLRAGLRPSRAAGPIAAALAVGLPVWGAMQDLIRSDFHPEVTGVVLALFAGWAGLTGRPRACWAFAVVALLTREDLAFGMLVIGLVIAIRAPRRMRLHGRALVGVASAWGVIVFGLLMPLLRAGAANETSSYYAWLGGGLNVLAAPFTMTGAVFAALTRPAPWFVFAGMVASLAGLPLLRPRWAAVVIPPLVALLLSRNSFQAALLLQYPVILIVPLLTATLFGGRRALWFVLWARRRRRRRAHPHLRPAIVALVGLLAIPAIAGAWIQGSLPPFDGSDPAFRAAPGAIERLRAVAGAVPGSAILVTDEGLVAPLAGRIAIRSLASVLDPSPDAFVLLDRNAWSPTVPVALLHDRVDSKLASGLRPVLADDGRFVLWGPEPGGRAP